MLIIYKISIALFDFLLPYLAKINAKAMALYQGRKAQNDIWKNVKSSSERFYWFHFASLGEFEQGRPLIERIKQQHPNQKIAITFFSPSGFEIRKNYPLADIVLYLPSDTESNAREFIKFLNPEKVFFVKYEYWYFFFKELHTQKIPLYIVSAIFRKNQIFFKFYGGLYREILAFVTHFFVQNQTSKELLNQLKFDNVTVTGDTRFDAVYRNAKTPKNFPSIEVFKNDQFLFIAGSTWAKDEKLIIPLMKQNPNWKFIIAPHDVTQIRIQELTNNIDHAILFTESLNSDIDVLKNKQTVIVDNIGSLSSLYQFGNIAYIGGGFNKGIHNTLEAISYGIPVVFGKRYHKFQEAKDLINIGVAMSVVSQEELSSAVISLVSRDIQKTKATINEYINKNINASERIMQVVEQ